MIQRPRSDYIQTIDVVVVRRPGEIHNRDPPSDVSNCSLVRKSSYQYDTFRIFGNISVLDFLFRSVNFWSIEIWLPGTHGKFIFNSYGKSSKNISNENLNPFTI